MFEMATAQLKGRGIAVKTGTLADATIVASAREDGDGRPQVKGRAAAHGSRRMSARTPSRPW